MLDRSLFFSSAQALIQVHGERLRSLVGQEIQASWLAWDLQDDEWFADEAVILQVGDTNLEAGCFQLEEMVLTWNSIDTSLPPRWIANWAETGFQLEWRRDARQDLNKFLGCSLVRLFALEYLWETTVLEDRRHPETVGQKYTAWLLHGLELETTCGSLVIYNALDKNGILHQAPLGQDYRKVAI